MEMVKEEDFIDAMFLRVCTTGTMGCVCVCHILTALEVETRGSLNLVIIPSKFSLELILEF
jgi:hypothetical protein